MMKSIYGKLICGFLITIVFSFSVAGYVALRSNYDQIADMAQNEFLSGIFTNIKSYLSDITFK